MCKEAIMLQTIPCSSIIVIMMIGIVTEVTIGIVTRLIDAEYKRDKISKRIVCFNRAIVIPIRAVIYLLCIVYLFTYLYRPVIIPKVILYAFMIIPIIGAILCLYKNAKDLQEYFREEDDDIKESQFGVYTSGIILTVMVVIFNLFFIAITFGSWNPYL